MLVAALAIKDHEYYYNASTARRVSKASGQKIVDIANECNFLYSLYPENNCVWHLYEVSSYDPAYIYAENQWFSIRNGVVTSHVR